MAIDSTVSRLQELIQCRTVSSNNLENIDFNEFFRLHQVLEQQYPRIHQALTKIVIGKASLLYCWKGQNPNLKPFLWMAHIDVVPVGDETQWHHGPFSGEIAEGYLWGRGTADTKCLITVQMDAIEELLVEGFTPQQDIYLFYGHNEEIVAPDDVSGAKLAMEYLREQGVTLGCVLDEGGSIVKGSSMGIEKSVAVIGVSEKGSVHVELSVHDKGGHSSTPEKTTALSRVARAAVAVEEHPMPVRLLPMVADMLKTLAPLMGGLKPIMANPTLTWPILRVALQQKAMTNAMIRTTFAVTMAKGSAQANVLPETASVVINCRVLPGDTMESTLQHIKANISKGVEARILSGKNPSPISPTDTKLFSLLRSLAQELQPEALVTPYLVMGGTDSAKFYPICEAVYRFSPFFFDEKTMTGVHSVNERISTSGFGDAVQFYKKFAYQYLSSLS
jgi:carboxypeptidase PM20D1